MYKNYFKAVLVALVLFNLAGCKKEPTVGTDEDRQVIVFFSTQSVSASFLKGTPPTPATGAETLIEEIILFGVDASDNVIQTVLINDPDFTGQEIDAFRNTVKFYAIANPSEDMKNKAIFDPATIADFEELYADFSTAPESPFLMSGTGDVEITSEGDRYALITLIRAIAKIEIAGIEGFDLESVTVINTPELGYVFEGGTLVPNSANMTEYPTANSVVDNKITVYVAENSMDNPTQFIVNGTYEGQTISYNLVLKLANNPIDIKRNTYYQVVITGDPEKIGSVRINIPEWDDVETEDQEFPDSE